MSAQSSAIIAFMVVAYILITSGISIYYTKYTKTNDAFMTASKTLPGFIIGILVMSEFIGSPSTVGAATQAFNQGIAAHWSVTSCLIAFVLFGYFLAPKFFKTGEYTISGIIAKRYGNGTRLAVSLIMMYGLFVVNVSSYSSGAAAITAVLKTSTPVALIIIAAVGAIYIATGGLKGVAYVSMIHVAMKYLGVLVALWIGWSLGGNLGVLQKNLPAFYFSSTGKVGWATIIAWTIGNIGTVFVTQQIIQAISGVKNEKDAKTASIVGGILTVPIGIFAAFVGLQAKYLFPKAAAAQALPGMAAHTTPWIGGIVTTAITAMVFASASTLTLAIVSLLIKDFYIPYFKPSKDKELKMSRILSIIIAFLPIPFALFAPGILQTMFFSKALRTSIAVVAVAAFSGSFSSGKAAIIGLLGACVGASIWFFMGNPYKIDNIYVALVIPIVVMVVDHLIFGNKRKSMKLGTGQAAK